MPTNENSLLEALAQIREAVEQERAELREEELERWRELARRIEILEQKVARAGPRVTDALVFQVGQVVETANRLLRESGRAQRASAPSSAAAGDRSVAGRLLG